MGDKVFFLVWNPRTSQTRYRHETYQAAKDEAERLARLNNGESFYVLQAVSCSMKPVETITRRLDDGIPF